MTSIETQWNNFTEHEWHQLLCQSASPVMLQQSFAYGETMRSYGATVHRAVFYYKKQPIACVQIVSKKRFFKQLTLAPHGPVWLAPSVDQKLVYEAMLQSCPIKKPVWLITPHTLGGDHSNIISVLKALGCYRVFSSDYHVITKLEQPSDTLWQAMDGNWRTAIRKFEKSALTVKKFKLQSEAAQLLIAHELKQRSNKAYKHLPADFPMRYSELSCLKNTHYLALGAMNQGQLHAGIIMLIHGHTASYYLGWSDEVGRTENALNALIWSASKRLQENSICWLDLGTIETDHAPGLASFKQGSGGQVLASAGTFWRRPFIA